MPKPQKIITGVAINYSEYEGATTIMVGVAQFSPPLKVKKVDKATFSRLKADIDAGAQPKVDVIGEHEVKVAAKNGKDSPYIDTFLAVNILGIHIAADQTKEPAKEPAKQAA